MECREEGVGQELVKMEVEGEEQGDMKEIWSADFIRDDFVAQSFSVINTVFCQDAENL